jgi:hypothetical protein
MLQKVSNTHDRPAPVDVFQGDRVFEYAHANPCFYLNGLNGRHQ